MPTSIETAMAALFTALLAPSNYQNCPSLKQVPFRDYDHIAGTQGDIAFEILARFIRPIVEHVDGLVSARASPSNLNAILCRVGPNASSKRNRLHQRCRLANHVGAWPNYFAC